MARSRPNTTPITGQPSRRADAGLRLELAAVVIVSIAVVLVAALFASDSSAVTTSDPLASTTADDTNAQQPQMPELTAAVDRPSETGQGDNAIPGRLDRYQVQRGETLQSISAEHRVSVDDIVAWNDHLDVNTALIRGEWLWIPRAEPSLVADEGIDAAAEESHGRGGG